jgi:hypothetical protein
VKTYLPVIVFCMSIAPPVLADGIPAQLRNKTIRISGTATTPVKGPHGTIMGSRTSSATLYVSTLGRVFERGAVRASNGASGGSESAPGVKPWRFTGGKLVSYRSEISGAILLEISFDGSFQSCTLSAIIGHEGDKSRKWAGVNGRKYESAGSATVSGESCSIAEGNGL